MVSLYIITNDSLDLLTTFMAFQLINITRLYPSLPFTSRSTMAGDLEKWVDRTFSPHFDLFDHIS